MAEQEQKSGGMFYKKSVMANLFGITARRLEQLTADGVLPTVKVNKQGVCYDFIPTIQRYIKYLQERAAGKERTETQAEKELAKLDAEIMYKKAKAEKAKLEADEIKGKMHRAEDVKFMTEDLVLAIRSSLLALPGRLAIDVADARNSQEASEIIRREVLAVLENLAGYEYNPESYKKRVTARTGVTADLEDLEDLDKEIELD